MSYTVHLQCPLCGHRYSVQSDQSRACPECAKAAGHLPSGMVLESERVGESIHGIPLVRTELCPPNMLFLTQGVQRP